MQAQIPDRKVNFLTHELRKLSSEALEILVGHTWGFQAEAFRILDERGLLLKVSETPVRTDKELAPGGIVATYAVQRKGIADLGDHPSPGFRLKE